MNELINLLKTFSTENFPVKKIDNFLANYKLPKTEIKDYIKFINKSYARHLVYKDSNFELLFLCWKPGQKAPIHGHEGEKCWMRVEEGALCFTNYNLISTDPLKLDMIDRTKGEAGYLDGPADVHSVENIYDENSISLHIYAKPYGSCDIYNTDSGLVSRKQLFYDTKYKSTC